MRAAQPRTKSACLRGLFHFMEADWEAD